MANESACSGLLSGGGVFGRRVIDGEGDSGWCDPYKLLSWSE